MKKLISVILAVMSFTVIQTSAVVERVYYDFTFADGYYYDLKTGVGKSDARFAVSSRKPVKSDSITIVGSNWHHILWWGENNQYIGYHNSTKSSYKTNLFNAFETTYNHIDVIDNDSFVMTSTRGSYTIFGHDWALDNIIPGVAYTITYDVTLLYKPDTPPTSSGEDFIARFWFYDITGSKSIHFANIPLSQYLDWEVGETVHVESTIEIPGTIDLSSYLFHFTTSVLHGEERPIMRVDNVRLTAGDTIPTGQYFGSADSVVTPPEGARYFHLQVCKERDNMVDFYEDWPHGGFDVINKNTFITYWRSEVVYEDFSDSYMQLFLDFERTYYISYAVHKLEEDFDNEDDVDIFFWWPKGWSAEDLGLADGPPDEEWRLAMGVSNSTFQSLPIGEFALVTGTFVADNWAWRGGPFYPYDYPPDLYVYTSDNGADMKFSGLHILPADSYDAQIESIREDPVEVFERFRSTQVYFERDITEPSTGSLPERLDNWLGSVGLNNTFFKILLSVVLMTVVAISLALMHAPASVVIFGTVLVLALVAFFGWVPLWIIIMTALVLLLTTIFKLKGAGGGSAEDD